MKPAQGVRVSTRELAKTQAELDGQVDEGIALAVKAAIEMLEDPETPAYVKATGMRFFTQPLARKLVVEAPMSDEVTPQMQFMSLMQEMRAPVAETPPVEPDAEPEPDEDDVEDWDAEPEASAS